MLFIKLASYDETTAETSIAHFSDLLCISLFIFYEKVLLVFCKFRILKFLLKYFYSSYRSHKSKIFPSSLSGCVHQIVYRFRLIIFLHLCHHLQYLASPLLWSIVFISVWNAIKPRENYFLLIKPSAIRLRESASCKN